MLKSNVSQLNLKTYFDKSKVYVSNQKFNELSQNRLNELFSLRKKTFHDRLQWQVKCEMNLEFDVYDNFTTEYILGEFKGEILFGVRLIESCYDNMIVDVFSKYFENLKLPKGNFVEASRLFVDKDMLKKFDLNGKCLSLILFLSMILHTKMTGCSAMYAIVSKQMHTIFKRVKWNVEILSEGISEKKEKIYFIMMPIDDDSMYNFIDRIINNSQIDKKLLINLPMVIDPDLLKAG